MASPMGPIVVDSGTPPSPRGLPEPQVRKNLFAAGSISPIVDQLDAENCRVNPLTPDPHGHLGPAREAVALIQQAPSGTRQNPTMVESSPTPMSGLRRFPSLLEESPSLGAYPNPPSGSRLIKFKSYDHPGSFGPASAAHYATALHFPSRISCVVCATKAPESRHDHRG